MTDHANGTQEADLLNPEPPADNATSFQDIEGRTWPLKITVAIVRQVKAEIGIDLFAAQDGGALRDLGDDPMKICGLIWCLVRKQAEALDIDEATFWDGFNETTLDAATMAFFESLIAFSQEGKRKPLRLVLAKMKKAEALKMKKALELAESADLDKALAEMIETEHKTAKKMLASMIAPKKGRRPGGG